MKKLISLLLCLTMLTLPVLSSAEGVIGGSDGPTEIFVAVQPRDIVQDAIDAGRRVTQTYTISEFTLTSEDADEATAEAYSMVSSLLKSLSLSVANQGEESEFGLNINGTDVLTAGWVLNGDDAYINSNLIGGTVVIAGSEVEGLATRLVDMVAQIGLVTAEDAEEIKAQLPDMIETYAEELEGMVGSTLTWESLASWDYSSLTKAILPILDKVQTVETLVVPRMCDTAESGLSLNLSNEDVLSLLTGCVQFIQDNPDLMAYLSDSLGYYTKEDVDEMWEVYKRFNWYTEEQFYAIWPTLEGELNEALESLAAKPVLFFEDIEILIYMDAEDAPVYVTARFPIDLVDDSTVISGETVTDGTGETAEVAENTAVADEAVTEEAPAAETATEEVPAEEPTAEEVVTEETVTADEEPTQLVLDLVYTRQTVAEGVSHNCTLSGEGDSIVVTALEQGDTLHAELQLIETVDDVPTPFVTGVLDLTYIDTDTAFKTDLKASLTADGETMTVEVRSDYAIDGVDFAGTNYVAFSFTGISIAVSGTCQTCDPVPSIMTSDVARPAELDDAAFANWFVGVYSSLMNWVNTAMAALPEDVLNYFLMNY